MKRIVSSRIHPKHYLNHLVIRRNDEGSFSSSTLRLMTQGKVVVLNPSKNKLSFQFFSSKIKAIHSVPHNQEEFTERKVLLDNFQKELEATKDSFLPYIDLLKEVRTDGKSVIELKRSALDCEKLFLSISNKVNILLKNLERDLGVKKELLKESYTYFYSQLVELTEYTSNEVKIKQRELLYQIKQLKYSKYDNDTAQFSVECFYAMIDMLEYLPKRLNYTTSQIIKSKSHSSADFSLIKWSDFKITEKIRQKAEILKKMIYPIGMYRLDLNSYLFFKKRRNLVAKSFEKILCVENIIPFSITDLVKSAECFPLKILNAFYKKDFETIKALTTPVLFQQIKEDLANEKTSSSAAFELDYLKIVRVRWVDFDVYDETNVKAKFMIRAIETKKFSSVFGQALFVTYQPCIIFLTLETALPISPDIPWTYTVSEFFKFARNSLETNRW